MPGIQEFVIVVLIIVVLSMTGLWPMVVRGLRELRGEATEEDRQYSAAPSARGTDLCFRLLGVSSSSPWEEIERAYRSKAKVHHPDRGGDEDAMRALNEAYQQIKRLRGH